MNFINRFFSYKPGFYSGTVYDRVDDLKFLKPLILNNTVLDIGSNIGIVAYEIGKFKPKKIHLLERSSRCLNISKVLLSSVNFSLSFNAINLSKSRILKSYIRTNKIEKSYDVVLMLAIYQHMKKQSSAKVLSENINDIFSLANKFIVFRVPLKLKKEIYSISKKNGFDLFFEKPENNNRGPLIVFKKFS